MRLKHQNAPVYILSLNTSICDLWSMCDRWCLLFELQYCCECTDKIIYLLSFHPN